AGSSRFKIKSLTDADAWLAYVFSLSIFQAGLRPETLFVGKDRQSFRSESSRSFGRVDTDMVVRIPFVFLAILLASCSHTQTKPTGAVGNGGNCEHDRTTFRCVKFVRNYDG